MIGTLAASARTAPAKTLKGAVPEVDQLAVRIVTDNIVIQFVPTEKRDGVTIERRSGNTRPDAPPRTILNGEWGLAMHAQSFIGGEERNVMIDFGYTPEVLINVGLLELLEPLGRVSAKADNSRWLLSLPAQNYSYKYQPVSCSCCFRRP